MSGASPVTVSRRPGRAHWTAFTIAAVAALVADQLTKALVRDGITPGERIDVAPAVDLVHTTNRGVAFGLFQGRQGIVAVLTALALVAIAAVLVALGRRTPWVMAGAGLLVGGSIGNLVDRLGRGGVTDFLAVSAWPAFNVADIAIVVGAGILAAGIIGDGERRD